MAFKVKARVLLELGAELISSDGIALYELIKNAIDARSPKIEVRFNVALSSSGYQALVSDIQDGGSSIDGKVLRNASKYFEPSATQAIRDELVEKLSGLSKAQALSRLRDFYCKTSFIEIEDWGQGMSLAGLDRNFLTIGTPNRAEERKLAVYDKDKPILGEKGIGRLSVMRLGEKLKLSTATIDDEFYSILNVDWKLLGDNLDLDLDSFSVGAEVGNKKEGKKKGTLIRISDLRSDWSLQRVSQVSKTQLSKLQDPFDLEGSVLDLRMSFNGKSVDVIEELNTVWLEGEWHGHFKVRFNYEMVDGRRQPMISGKVKFRPPALESSTEDDRAVDEADIYSAGDDLYSVLADADQPLYNDGGNTPARYAGIQTLGEFTAEGYWFNRQRKRKELPKEKYDEFSEWLSLWAGGLLMYRDGFRVYPYADPDDDWLMLDQRALKQRSFKLNRGQFVGYVRISSRDNPNLKDQTNRQGLCDSPEQKKLVQCLQYVIWKELGALVKKYEVKSAARSLGTVKEIDVKVKKNSKDARAQLRELAKQLPGEEKTIHALRGYVEELETAWSKAKATIRKQQDQSDVYLHLAGAGMLMEFVVHELNRMTRATLADLNKVNTKSLPPSLRSLNAQLKTLEKRLRILDPVSTPGRQRKERADMVEVIQTLLDAHESQFEQFSIEVIFDEIEAFFARVVQGQMYQVFENLISNSVYWLSHHHNMLREASDGATNFSPTIEIVVDSQSREIVFRDNGSGIRVEDGRKVFDPFFSKKPSGRGIGLYIVKNLCSENNIDISLIEAGGRGAHAGFVFRFGSE
ncbi:ATP-binding protein [Pseudomonas sp. PA15(2017)]|uniref:ATP-binding protein n=1 Tax=Pseudomonas sp. PA15(2017) TaxID=1932111 RepID=UPI000A579BB9|nr:ATP-binding protein [Pseudomonas sp. PA15(2017)]